MRLYFIPILILSMAGLPAEAQQSSQQRARRKAEIVAKSRRPGGSGISFPGVPKGIITSPEPGFLTVNARAQIDHHQFSHDTLHYWRLDVLDAAGTVLWKKDYDHQEFTMKGGVLSTRDFRERLQLPPGRYLVRVWLLDVKWDLDEWGLPALVSTIADGRENAIMSSYLAIVK